MKRHTAPIIAVVLLLLPVLYVGSYLALVVPERAAAFWAYDHTPHYYRFGGGWSIRIFWPLEQIDRKVRPEAWEPPLQPQDYGELNR